MIRVDNLGFSASRLRTGKMPFWALPSVRANVVSLDRLHDRAPDGVDPAFVAQIESRLEREGVDYHGWTWQSACRFVRQLDADQRRPGPRRVASNLHWLSLCDGAPWERFEFSVAVRSSKVPYAASARCKMVQVMTQVAQVWRLEHLLF